MTVKNGNERRSGVGLAKVETSSVGRERDTVSDCRDVDANPVEGSVEQEELRAPASREN